MTSRARSLLRTEAQARAALLDVTSYDVRLDLTAGLDDARPTFRSVTTLDFRSRAGATFLDLKPVAVHGIRLDDRALDPDLLEQGRLPLDTAEGEHRLVVDATMPFRNDGEGLHLHVDPADGRRYVYGMCFMDAAPTIFACFDQLDLKAPYTLHVTAPEDWTVIGNGPATAVGAGQWELATTQPLSTYFVTLVAGPYHVLRDEHDGIRLGLSSRASLAGALDVDADELFTMTRQCFDEFHRLFGIRYPFGDYHQAFVPEFNAGAMENPGCVTFRDPLLFTSRATRGDRIQRATTVAHELAHQWFGNIVTPRWWDDLWLNESFAEYLGNRVTADVTQYDDAWVHVAYARRQWGLSADQRSSTHPVAGNGAADALGALQDFDGISYAKGSSILGQLATSLGDEVFFGGVVDHLTRHRFGNATLADLIGSWEAVGAGDLGELTSQWLTTAGPDTLSLDRSAGVVRRTPPPGRPADRSHTAHAAIHRAGAWRLQPLHVRGAETTLVVRDEPVLLDPHLESWLATPPDPVTAAALPAVVGDIDDPLLLAGLWSSLCSGVRDASLDPALALATLEARFPAEDTQDTKRHLMPWVLGTLVPLAGPDALARVHAASTAATTSYDGGSELQLAAFRAAVTTGSDTGQLAAWRDGEDLPAELELDDDLFWRVVVRLATLGAVSREDLDSCLARVPGERSQVAHTAAVASLPDADAKAWAWARFTGEVDVTVYELEAAGAGMWRGGQEHLTGPYVARYFDELPGTAAVRSGWVLADAADFFFPRTSLTEPTLARARALVADESVDGSVRRRVGDDADDLEALLAARAAWPQSSS